MAAMTEENDKMNSHPAPQHRLADLRDWLMDRIDGGEEMRGEDGLVSDFIRQIDAQDAELADIKQRLLPQFAGRTQRAEHERDALLEQLIAARSATGEPVAWMYEESGERMFGHPDGYRPLGAVPLYAGSPPVEEKAIGHALNTLDIIANWGDEENEWDAVVKYRSVRDRAATHVAILRSPMKGEPVDHGYDRTASLNAGKYVCTCGACSHYTTKEQP